MFVLERSQYCERLFDGKFWLAGEVDFSARHLNILEQ
jgi:hypothetical protein